MKREDLKILLDVLRLRVMDEPQLKRCYDELLDAYNKTAQRPDWRIPVQPSFTYLEISR